MHTQLMNCCFGFQSQWRVYDVSTNYMKYTHLIYEALFFFFFNWIVFGNFKVKCTAHPTYETLFCILLKLEYLACNFIPNALRTLLMMCCFDFNHI